MGASLWQHKAILVLYDLLRDNADPFVLSCGQLRYGGVGNKGIGLSRSKRANGLGIGVEPQQVALLNARDLPHYELVEHRPAEHGDLLAHQVAGLVDFEGRRTCG